MVKVELRGIRKAFGTVTVIPELDLEIASGEFIALVGPSGCGKSTLLRMVAGLDEPTSGEIRIDNKIVNDISPKSRGVGMVFQNYALYPHMTVRENLEFSLKLAKLPRDVREERIRSAADWLGLGELLSRRPSQLSGGQKQRVAMGRAVVRQPRVLLFDEPLSNLDAQLRIKVRAEIAELHRKIRSTVIYVTHDQVEAMTLADRIAVLNRGHLEQVGAPIEVYRNPRTQFVASFIGTPPMNFLPAASLPRPLGRGTWAGLRPENAHLENAGGAFRELAQGEVAIIEPLGSTTHVHVRLPEGRTLVCELRGTPPAGLKKGDPASVYANPADLFYFDENGARSAGSA